MTERNELANGTKRAVRKDVTRNRALLLKAADELLAESGLDISLNELAKRAGVGVGTVYRHFADKDAVLAALFDQRLDSLAAILQEGLAREDPMDGLRHVLYTLGEMQAGDRALFQVMVVSKTAEQRAAVRKRLQPLGTELVRRAKATGQIRRDLSPTDIPMLLWVSMSINDYAGTVRADLWRRYVELALIGFGADEPVTVKALTPDEMEQALHNWRR
jgi:AcrR family transcriptional regulator